MFRVEPPAAGLRRQTDKEVLMNTRPKSMIFPVLFLGLAAVACSRSPSAPVVPVPSELLNAPNEIVVGSSVLRLTTYLWRDFQPSTSPDTRLLAQLQIRAADEAVPSTLVVEKAWLILANEAWLSTPRQERPPAGAGSVEYMSRGGPEWPVGALVTAVIQLRDASNNSYLLRASPQAILRTD